MPSLRDRIVEIAYKLKDQFSLGVPKITGGIEDINEASDKSAANIEKNNKRVEKSYTGLSGILTKVRLGVLAFAAAAGGAVGAIGAWTRASAIQERAEIKLETTLRNLTGASEDQVEALKEQAAALQELTGYGDEQTISAQAMLGTFKLTADEIAVLTPRLLDMAESQRKAGASSVDLESISIALGKAFTSGIGSLTRYGVAMDEAQKAAFKAADQTEKVALLAEILDGNFQGLAASVGQSYEGALRKAEAASGDFREELGGLFTQNESFIELNQLIGDSWASMTEGIKNSSAEIGNVVTFFSRTVSAIVAEVRIAFNGITAVLNAQELAIKRTASNITEFFSNISFGGVSERFARISQEMAAEADTAAQNMTQDFEDVEDAIRDLSDAMNDTKDGVSGVTDSTLTQKAATDALSRSTGGLATNTKTLKDRTKELEASLKAASKAAEKEVDDFANVAAASDEIRAKFAALTDEIAGVTAKTEGFTFTDVVQQMTAAREALAAGDFTGAIDGATAAGDMLRDMSQKGEESAGTLTALSLKLEEIAKQATQGQIDKELIEAEGAIEEVDKVKAELAALADSPVAVKLDVDSTAIEELRTIEPIKIPIQYELVGGLPALSDTMLQNEANKRGNRL